MRQFQLERVRSGGKTYRGCILSVEETQRQAELTYIPRKLFGARPVTLAKFVLDPKTRLARDGTTLRLGDVEMVASNSEDASAIASIFDAPRRAAMELAGAALAVAEERARGLLRARGETLTFLDGLRRDPAKAMLDLYVSKRLPAEVAKAEYLKSRAEALAAALAGLDSALEDLSGKAGQEVAERVYAVTYVAGTLQTDLFERGEPGSEVRGFLSELGIRDGDLSPPFEGLPERLVAASHQSTAALLG